MVVFTHKHTHSWLQAAVALAGGLYVLCVSSGEAHAGDWREKLRDGRDAGVAAEHDVSAPDGSFAYRGEYRLGFTSNANEDFDPRSSGTLESQQELQLKRKARAVILGGQLRGSIDTAWGADEINYGDMEARASIAGQAGNGRELALTGGYKLEHDKGFRSHDRGLNLSTRKRSGEAVQFTTLTVNSISHDDQSLFGFNLDNGDNDRLRVGLESGYDLPAAGGIAPTFSLGLVDVTHERAVDLGGYRRDSTAVFLRAAARLTSKGPLSGSFGVLAFRRDYDAPEFTDRVYLLPEAELTWRLQDKTSLTLSYLEDLEETPFYGSSNLHTSTTALTLTRKLDKVHTLSAALYRERDSYLDTPVQETSRGAAVEFSRMLNDNLSLGIMGEYERVSGTGYLEEIEIWKFFTGFKTNFSK